MKRPTYTVYCETCRQFLKSVVLGGREVKYTRPQAEDRAFEHKRMNALHVVIVKEKA